MSNGSLGSGSEGPRGAPEGYRAAILWRARPRLSAAAGARAKICIISTVPRLSRLALARPALTRSAISKIEKRSASNCPLNAAIGQLGEDFQDPAAECAPPREMSSSPSQSTRSWLPTICHKILSMLATRNVPEIEIDAHP